MLKAGYGSGPSIKKSSIKKKLNFTPSFNKLSNTKVLSKWAINNVPKTIKNGTCVIGHKNICNRTQKHKNKHV